MEFSHSFVIPSHNHGRYIGGAIESLLAQDEPTSQIVVCDDFSTDDSREVIERFRGRPRVRIAHPPVRKGMIPNYNWAVSQAQTEWVSVLCSDDIALPQYATAMREGAARSKNAVVISADFDHIDGAGALLRKEKVLSAPALAHPPRTFETQLTAVKVHPAAHGFRRSVWVEVGGFPEECRLFGDWGFWLKASPKGDFVHVRRRVAQYRIDYRPDIGRARLPDALRDDSWIMTTLIPQIARENFPQITAAAILKAQRQRLRAVLSDCSRALAPTDRDFVVDILKEWAGSIGEHDLLGKFAAGDTLTVGWRNSGVRRVLRDIYKIFA
jgi:hypothetical protein